MKIYTIKDLKTFERDENGRTERSDGKRARKTGTEREYSSAELNALFDNLDDVKI